VYAEGFAADATAAVPLERWDPQTAPATALFGPSPLRFSVFLPPGAAPGFDAAAFGVSAPEAALMDPQQRLLLEAAAEVLLSAGAHGVAAAAAAAAAEAAGAADGCSVFIGISSMDYAKMGSRYAGEVTAYSATGLSLSVAAGRLSYTFGLRGPAVAVDTACSSSLVAAHSAALSLERRQQRDARALVGGVNLTLYPDTPAMFKRAGMLAPDGRCKTLDAAADGYVRAEAVGVLLLQAASAAASDVGALPPLALLAGSAVNQDGRSSGLTAPNGPAQQEVLRAALVAAGLAPGDVSGISMHGTGTGLGDPIEVGALAAVFSSSGGRAASAGAQAPLLLGASKSWLGHAEPAAGVVGVAHAAREMAGRLAPPIAHLRALNPYVSRFLEPAAPGGAPHAARGFGIGRQQGGAAAPEAAALARGVSAFAFQVG
jgi:acyl transferase domain-containing protein